jgi:hypothetical protein
MAEAKEPRAVRRKFDPDRMYRVWLIRDVPFLGTVLRPGGMVLLKGDALSEIDSAAIKNAEPET